MSDCIGSGSDFREMDRFVSVSLETHLFFGRIMKEHSFFLMAGFPSINVSHIRTADWFRMQFENLLWETVEISDGVVSNEVLESGEIRTEFTLEAEKITSRLTGIPIEIQITQAEEKLRSGCFTGNREDCDLRINIHFIVKVIHPFSVFGIRQCFFDCGCPRLPCLYCCDGCRQMVAREILCQIFFSHAFILISPNHGNL